MACSSRVLVVARVWGLGSALVVAFVVGCFALMVGDVFVPVPGVRDIVAVLHMVPGLAAIALAFPLIERTPDLTVLSAHSPNRLFALRFIGVVGVSLPVAVCVDLAGWSASGAAMVLGFVGLAAVASAALGIWYWGPALVLMYAWIHWPGRDSFAFAGPFWLAVWLAVVGVCGVSYVVISARRVHRVVRGVGAKSGSGQGLDTIRP